VPAEKPLEYFFKERCRRGHNRFFDERLELLADVMGSHVSEGRVVAESRMSISRSELRILRKVFPARTAARL